MPKPIPPINLELGIQPGRDPLVNENPELNDKDYLAYLKSYIADGKVRMDDLNRRLNDYKEKNHELTVKVPYTRGFQYYKEIINGFAIQGLLNTDTIAKGVKVGNGMIVGEAYIKLLFRHAAGLAELAVSEAGNRF